MLHKMYNSYPFKKFFAFFVILHFIYNLLTFVVYNICIIFIKSENLGTVERKNQQHAFRPRTRYI